MPTRLTQNKPGPRRPRPGSLPKFNRLLNCWLPLVLLVAVFTNCEDPIDVPSDFEEPQLVIDAWLTNQAEPQTIILTETQAFFDNRLPTTVDNAEVVVCRGEGITDCLVFEPQGDGRYTWTPEDGETIGEVGQTFSLGIRVDGQEYVAQTMMDRVPPIDSISFQFEEESLGFDEGFYAQLYARDLPGRGDAYFIRTIFNDTLLLRPFEISTAYDVTFEPGADADGTTFIFPIRSSINRLDDDGATQPLRDGDELRVELWSVSDEAFFWLGVATEQVANGDNSIFAVPVANSPSNILNVDTESPALGIFNVAAVSVAERTFEE